MIVIAVIIQSLDDNHARDLINRHLAFTAPFNGRELQKSTCIRLPSCTPSTSRLEGQNIKTMWVTRGVAINTFTFQCQWNNILFFVSTPKSWASSGKIVFLDFLTLDSSWVGSKWLNEIDLIGWEGPGNQIFIWKLSYDTCEEGPQK